MKKPIAILIRHSDISVIVEAMRTCTNTTDLNTSYCDYISNHDKKIILEKILKIKPNNKEERNNEPKHDSILEHLNYTFKLSFSRAVLQEIARHRIASISVMSTRYTLKKMVKEISADNIDEFFIEHLMESGDEEVDILNEKQLLDLINIISEKGLKNDISKYAIPEGLVTKCIFTINARSLRNLFFLRTHKRALKEFQDLARLMYDRLPENHKFLFDDVVWNYEKK